MICTLYIGREEFHYLPPTDFDYDKLVLAYGIKKGSISFSIEFSGMTH